MTEAEALAALRGPDRERAARAEAALWTMWCRSGDPGVDALMREGMAARNKRATRAVEGNGRGSPL